MIGRHHLQHDDPAVRRVPPFLECAEDLPRIERKIRAQRLAPADQSRPIPSGVCDQEHHSFDPPISSLEGQLARESLPVRDARLGFDGCPLVAGSDEGIPRTPVAFYRECDLGLPFQRDMDPLSQPLQQRRLGGITQRIAAGKEPHREIQTQRGRDATKLSDRQARDGPALHTSNLCMGDARGASNRLLAQASGQSGVTELGSNSQLDLAAHSRGSIYWSLAGRHHRKGSLQAALASGLPPRCLPSVQSDVRRGCPGVAAGPFARPAFNPRLQERSGRSLERPPFRDDAGAPPDGRFERLAFRQPESA